MNDPVSFESRWRTLHRFASMLLRRRFNAHDWRDAVRVANTVFFGQPLMDCDVMRLCDELRPHDVVALAAEAEERPNLVCLTPSED